MIVYKKLQDARLMLQNTKLTKSGKNKFAGYEYFVLADFLPAIQNICQKLGLCGVVSFNQEMAYLTIYDTEGGDGDFVTFTSPMSTASLKGSHEVQNLGAVQTYLRRYLWTNAFEIVENDILDETANPDETPKFTAKPVAPKPVIKTVNGYPVDENLKTIGPKSITGQKGEFQIVAPGIPDSDLDIPQWLANIKEAAKVLLAVADNEEDVMHIFKKNKTLFDIVKATDAVFFKDLMALFTAARTQLTKE